MVNKRLQYTYCPISQEVKGTRDQLTEYNKKDIFVEKLCTKCAGEIILRPLSKKPKLSISLDRYCKVCFYCMLI